MTYAPKDFRGMEMTSSFHLPAIKQIVVIVSCLNSAKMKRSVRSSFDVGREEDLTSLAKLDINMLKTGLLRSKTNTRGSRIGFIVLPLRLWCRILAGHLRGALSLKPYYCSRDLLAEASVTSRVLV